MLGRKPQPLPEYYAEYQGLISAGDANTWDYYGKQESGKRNHEYYNLEEGYGVRGAEEFAVEEALKKSHEAFRQGQSLLDRIDARLS